MTGSPISVVSDLPMAMENKLEDRLTNWVRWTYAYSAFEPGHCASIEHRYVSPWVDDEDSANRNLPWGIDSVDAYRLQQAFARLDERHRAFLVVWYVKKRPVERIARSMKVEENELQPMKRRVLRALLQHLDAIERGEAVLIRRGAPIWAGIAKAKP